MTFIATKKQPPTRVTKQGLECFFHARKIPTTYSVCTMFFQTKNGVTARKRPLHVHVRIAWRPL